MDVQITPVSLRGTVTPPSSKSMTHRAILAAALTEGTSQVRNIALSQDIQATLRCVRAFGSQWKRAGEDALQVSGLWSWVRETRTPARYDCGESGSTLRFMIPLALALTGGGVFTGKGRLMQRPQKPYFDLFEEKGIFYEQRDGVLTLRGELTPGEFRLPGNVSSQFVTGLLYALPLLKGDSEIVITSTLESRSYVDMTLETLERFGVRVENRGYERFLVPGGQRFTARDVTIEADWSQAAFWYAAQSLKSMVRVTGLSRSSSQGDRIIGDWLVWLTQPDSCDIDVSNCPDLVPPLAVMAAFHEGSTRLVNAARLRLKESDRLETVTRMLLALGGQVEEGPDSLTIWGQRTLPGGTVDGANDHRIVMAAAVAAVRCRNPVSILGAEAVNKSYPGFWDDYKMLGGIVNVL